MQFLIFQKELKDEMSKIFNINPQLLYFASGNKFDAVYAIEEKLKKEVMACLENLPFNTHPTLNDLYDTYKQNFPEKMEEFRKSVLKALN